MATKKPKTNRGGPDFDIFQKMVSEQLRGQKLNPTQKAEIAQTMRFENDYIDRADMKENFKRAKQGSRARQGRINVTKSKTTKAQKAPSTALPPRTAPGSGSGGRSLYSRLTGGGLMKHGR